MNKAIELITKELEEQRTKHGYDLQHDYLNNSEGQLITAAVAILEGNVCQFPKWPEDKVIKVLAKDKIGRLVTAAAMIAAELEMELHSAELTASSSEEDIPLEAVDITAIPTDIEIDFSLPSTFHATLPEYVELAKRITLDIHSKLYYLQLSVDPENPTLHQPGDRLSRFMMIGYAQVPIKGQKEFGHTAIQKTVFIPDPAALSEEEYQAKLLIERKHTLRFFFFIWLKSLATSIIEKGKGDNMQLMILDRYRLNEIKIISGDEAAEIGPNAIEAV